METTALEEAVYAAMTGDMSLISLLHDGENSIYHLQAPSDNVTRYPILVYSPISDVPAFSSDDFETAHRVTIRIHVITKDGQYGEIQRHSHRIMQGLGFYRIQTSPYVEDDEIVLLTDYKIGVML